MEKIILIIQKKKVFPYFLPVSNEAAILRPDEAVRSLLVPLSSDPGALLRNGDALSGEKSNVKR